MPNESSSSISIVTIVNQPGLAKVESSAAIDDEIVEKIKQLTKKKQKKTAAPLPPQSLSPCSSNSPHSSSSQYSSSSPTATMDTDQTASQKQQQQQHKELHDTTHSTAKKLFLSMSESSSSPTTYPSPSLSDASSSGLQQPNVLANSAADVDDKRLHITKINNSLVMPVVHAVVAEDVQDVDKHNSEVNVNVKRNSSIQSSSESSEVDYPKSADNSYKFRNGRS